MQVIVEWSTEKNELLKKEKNVCFEDVENYILNDEIVDVVPHWNLEKYPNQRVFVLRLNGYIHYVPFVEDDEKIFLKTVVKSRKLNRIY